MTVDRCTWLGLGQVVPTLIQRYDGPAAGYQELLALVHKGAIPAEFVNKRWRVQDENLDGIAHTLGMTPKASQAA
jgi:hypothetical protein